MTDAYFNELMVNRQRLLWAIATRRQLERWEPIVATFVRVELLGDGQMSEADGWSAAMEHHFLLVAANNLLRALDLDPATSVPVDATLRAELREGRDLHEHWPENLPAFTGPRDVQPPRRSGKAFAARNPDRGPYQWMRWTSKTGAQLLPNISASAVHELLDAVEADVLARDFQFSAFVPPRAPSPWLHQDGEWWPVPSS